LSMNALSQLSAQTSTTKTSQVAPLSIDDWRSTHKSRSVNALSSAGEVSSNSRQPAHVREFQSKLASQAEEASRSTGIPAKFLLGQAALESGWGRRELIGADGKASHNLFGIKATSGWKGKVVEAVTTEYVNGVPHARREKFRAYDSYAEAFKDYGNLLSKNPRYENVIANSKDATSFARGLQKAGYATDPNYAAKLTRIINNSLSDTPSIAKNS
ncbi:MAG: flagellar assembly peptidoglycan hydrolase FlgJ, partial [Burkholderiales bacterium]|nr:flagellar assembly peptidoglycan hydrolase FlgJ [Burkholderiales bacterium]